MDNRNMRAVSKHVWAFLLALVIVVAGFIFLSFGVYRAALFLTIYPTSFIFHAAPRAWVQQQSDDFLFWTGMLGGIAFWYAAVLCTHAFMKRLRIAIATGRAILHSTG